MMASTSPSSMAARAVSRSGWSTGTRMVVRATASRIWPAAGVPSWSTHATVYSGVPPPEKIVPKSTMKMTGNAIVQKSAARSRTKLLRLAMVRVHRARIPRASVAQRPTGQVEEDVFERRASDLQVLRIHAQRLGGVQHGADGAWHVTRVEDRLAALFGHA